MNDPFRKSTILIDLSADSYDKDHMNISRFQKLKAVILEFPDQFDTDDWFQKRENVKHCGTSACLAGWAVTLQKTRSKNPYKALCAIFSKEEVNDFDEEGYTCTVIDNSSTVVENIACEYLGITSTQGKRLFYDLNWPTNFGDEYNFHYRRKKYLAAAEVVVARLDHFIATNGGE